MAAVRGTRSAAEVGQCGGVPGGGRGGGPRGSGSAYEDGHGEAAAVAIWTWLLPLFWQWGQRERSAFGQGSDMALTKL